jgi:hypothetical protein
VNIGVVMSKKVIEITNEGSNYKVCLSGFLDEEVNFSECFCESPQQIEVDFSKLKSINSCGIRGWILWLRQYSNCKIIYINCPKIIIDQINMVDGFLPKNVVINSFYVPYYSEISDSKKDILFTYGKEFSENKVTPPNEIVDELGNPMEMDVLVKKYFKFLMKN